MMLNMPNRPSCHGVGVSDEDANLGNVEFLMKAASAIAERSLQLTTALCKQIGTRSAQTVCKHANSPALCHFARQPTQTCQNIGKLAG